MLKGIKQGKFKRVPFNFTPKPGTLFLNLRIAFTTVSLLRYFYPLLPFCMESDTSGLPSLQYFLKHILRLDIGTPLLFGPRKSL